ncbi:MAG: bifunctional salicylyl-CoA 5-hydroxylase/oxidoreductase [bacterium]
MRIDIIGGGPGGLYFALLMKKADPGHEITVFERNRPDDTFGFGVVFSDETLDHVLAYDTESYREITDRFAYWDRIEVHFRGEAITSGGHGFCGLARITLLNILQRRCEGLGVEICYQTEISDLAPHREADLLVGADGVNSLVRETYRERFKPRIDFRKTKFTWLGTTRTFGPFTFFFKSNEHGWFCVHAYQYADAATTWIVECHEDTWRKAGLHQAGEAETIAYCEKLFADELQGHPLLANRSLWRNFPMVSTEHWHFENVVLLGDAVHTAQFSIGSGTKIALEDAIALYEAFQTHPAVPQALTAYQDSRQDEVGRLQAAAYTSLRWYEHGRRYNAMEPQQFVFNFLARTKGMTFDNLALRDPAYVAGVTRWFAEKVRRDGAFDFSLQPPPPPMFTPFRLRGLTLENRVVVSPMCQYSAHEGTPNDWHLVHLGGLAVGGAGLVFTEMTDVSPEGRITRGCAGMYEPGHLAAWRRIVDFVHANSRAKICIQLAHAGSKAATRKPWEGENEPLGEDGWPILAASPLPYLPHGQVPRQMERAEMDKVVGDFARAANMAVEAGFDMVELHMAHGYLLSGFISPLTNLRTDGYGGDLENRMAFPLQVLAAVREVLPDQMPLSVRISATDWVEDGGLDGDDAVQVARLLQGAGCDIVDVSAGQTTTGARPVYGRMFQTPFSEQIRHEAGVPTIAVGNITSADQVNTIIAAGRADLCALARPHLSDPHFTLRAAAQYGHEPQAWPKQYLPAKAQSRRLALAEEQRKAELLQAARPSSHRQGES